MKSLQCMVFDVDHGLCVLVRSPNNYGLLIDFGSKELFSPIKWIRSHMSNNLQFFEKKRFALAIVSHLHLDHFSDVGAFFMRHDNDPRRLLRDKESMPTPSSGNSAISNGNSLKIRRRPSTGDSTTLGTTSCRPVLRETYQVRTTNT